MYIDNDRHPLKKLFVTAAIAAALVVGAVVIHSNWDRLGTGFKRPDSFFVDGFDSANSRRKWAPHLQRLGPSLSTWIKEVQPGCTCELTKALYEFPTATAEHREWMGTITHSADSRAQASAAFILSQREVIEWVTGGPDAAVMMAMARLGLKGKPVAADVVEWSADRRQPLPVRIAVVYSPN